MWWGLLVAHLGAGSDSGPKSLMMAAQHGVSEKPSVTQGVSEGEGGRGGGGAAGAARA